MPVSRKWRPVLARWSALAALGLALVACNGRRDEHVTPAKPQTPTPGTARSRAKPELLHRESTAAPLEQFVQQHVEEADASGKRVLVYVGAKWCEPCQRFHRALESGQLDDVLAGTRFVEFDYDHDGAELRAAGYAPKFIPLFSIPDQSGHASGRAIEGSIKGDAAVRESLVPRLLALLDGRPTD
jgi:hypothetical protein